MKTFLKRTCAILVTLAMLVSCMIFVSVTGAAASAENGSEIVCSHIEFAEGTDDESNAVVNAKAFVRDLSGGTEEVYLFCASYDDEDNLIDVGVASGMNAVLKTSSVKTDGSAKTLAYIWKKSSIAPIAEVATYNAENVIPEITFDGKSFEEYIGQDFDPAVKSYDVNLIDNAATGIIKWPVVEAEASDNSALIEVSDDINTYSTIIKVSTGQRDVTTETVTGTSNTADREIYSRTSTEYKINYILPDGVYLNKEVEQYNGVKNESTGNNSILGGGNNFAYKYTQNVSLENEAYKTVTVKLASAVKQKSIIIVKPQDGTKKDVIVNADGSAITWVDDKDSNGAMVRKDCNEETGEETCGKISSENAATIAYGTSTLNLRVFKETEDSDNGWKSGSRIASDRSPARAQMGISAMAPELQGYNYIVFNDTVGTQSNAEVTFTINCDAEIIYLNTASGAATAADGWTTATDGKIAAKDVYEKDIECYAYSRYQNPMPAWTVAKLINEYGMSESRFYCINQNNLSVVANDGSLITKVDGFTVKRYDDFYNIISAIGEKVYVPISGTCNAAKYTTLTDALAAYRSCPSESGAIYSGAAMDYTDNPTPPPFAVRSFPLDGEGENYSVYSDRIATESANLTGMLQGYGDTLELENLPFFAPAVGWVNDSANNYVSTYIAADVKTPWYSFTAETDCEVILFSSGGCPGFVAEENSGWVKINYLSDEDCIRTIYNINTPATMNRNFKEMAVKKYTKGEKVQIYSPQNNWTMLLFVRKLPSKINTAADDKVGASNVITTGPNSYLADPNNGNAPILAERDVDGNLVTKVYTNRCYDIATNFHAKTEGELGSRVHFDRGYPYNDTYTNEVVSIASSLGGLLGSDYIMGPAEGTQRAANGFETSFTLYKSATIAVFAGSMSIEAMPNQRVAEKNGWKFRYNATPYITVQNDTSRTLNYMMTKHFEVTDAEAGLKVTIPKEMLYVTESFDKVWTDKDGDGEYSEGDTLAAVNRTPVFLAVICYDDVQ